MKTLKIASVAMMVVFALAGLSSSAQEFKEKPDFKLVVNMNYEKAMKDPLLVKLMYLQLNKQEYIDADRELFVATVICRNRTYKISGTREQWDFFFWFDTYKARKTKLPERRNNS